MSDGAGVRQGECAPLSPGGFVGGMDTPLIRRFELGFREGALKAKPKIKDSLDKIGINESTLFPEIESAARYIMSKVTPPADDEEGS